MSTVVEGGDMEPSRVVEATEMAEPQYVKAKTAVWWDIENCQVPKGTDAHAIAQNISSAIQEMGYLGPVSISAFGDTNLIPPAIQKALNSTGIALNHVPAGAKDASDKKILVNMFCWALDNPAPANCMLISGDRDFSDALHQLRLRRYNVLLAQPRKASVPLVHAARTVWLWTSLSAGLSPLTRAESLQLIANTTPEEGVPSSQLMESNSDTRRIYDNKSKFKYLPKLISYQPVAPKVYESSSNNNVRPQQNGVGKLIKKPHEIYRSSEPPPASTGGPAPSSNVSPFPGNVMSNPPNQYNYPPRPVPYPPRQPYPNPNLNASWNNGNSFPNQAQNYYHNGVRPGAPNNMRPPYGNGNVFQPYRPENVNPPMGNNVYRPMHPRNEGPRFSPPPFMATPQQYPNQPQYRPNFNHQVRQEFRPKTESSYPPSVNGPNKSYLPRSSSAPVTTGVSPSQPPNDTTGVTPSQPLNVTTGTGYSNGTWGTQECPPPSENVQGLIGVILHALNILKTEKVMPTEPNISDCIQYGDPKHRGTDVKKALESAVEHQMITVNNMGQVKLYIGKGEKLWSCVNSLGGNPKQYPKATWDRIQQFLTSSSGRVALMATQCSYEAAQLLKKECLKEYTVGDIVQILNTTATSKKWITFHQTAWIPIIINLAAETTNKTATETVTGIQTVA